MNELFTWRIKAQGICESKKVLSGTVQLIR